MTNSVNLDPRHDTSGDGPVNPCGRKWKQGYHDR